MIVSKDKKYKDKSGREVVIYAVYPDQINQYPDPVHGAVNTLGYWSSRTWNLDGSYTKNQSENDLVEIEEGKE